MKSLRHYAKNGGGILLAALMAGNVINFIYNAYLGRVLSFTDYGLLTLINTLYYIFSIVVLALSTTTTHRVGLLTTRYSKTDASLFLQKTRRLWLYGGGMLAFVFAIFSPLLAQFFKEANFMPLLMFAPVLLLGGILAINRGYLTGGLLFTRVALIVALEPLLKLLLAGVLVALGLGNWTYISIPISISIAALISIVVTRKKEKEFALKKSHIQYHFPKRFFAASVLTGLSSIAFLSFDLLLAKHFLPPPEAGKYALLSLVGKIIFFFGSLFNTFMIPLVSRAVGEGRNPRPLFYKLFIGVSFCVLCLFVILGPLGFIFVPFLLGNKAVAIVPFLTSYTSAIALFTIANSVVAYRLARQHYIFPVIAVLSSMGMALGIVFFHDNIGQITTLVLIASLINFVILLIGDFAIDYGRFVIRGAVDFIDLFFPLPKARPLEPGKKRILIFNWRDLKHKHAGGAEVYIHEIARRWAEEGNLITVFCGNDGESKRYEVIDNMQIIRRGGFYFVYLWAFLYYLVKFRGKYDVVIDCQNGIPFYTPLYVKEQVYCVMYHVHQEVFKKNLIAPLAWFASTLEKDVMPWAYRNTVFIAISESTKRDMERIGIRGQGIHLIHSGVDLESLEPGPKAKHPLILYLGRLKAYKSIDVLIHAFQRIVHAHPTAKLVIAGEGEEHEKLRSIVGELSLEDRVEFTGKVSEENKKKLLQQAWMLVNPSMMEGWGITTIEANACGTPVIASDVPGLRDAVRNPHTGYLVEHGNVKAFAHKIVDLLTNHKRRQEMSEEGVNWANRFNWKKSSDKFLNLLA